MASADPPAPMVAPDEAAPVAVAPPRAPLTIGAAATFGLVASLANVGFAMVRAKATALRLGPEGLGKVAEISQLVTLANVVTSTMTGAVLISQLARARADGDGVRVGRIFDGAWTGALLISALAGLTATGAGMFLLPAPWGPSAWPLTALGAAGVLFGIAATVPTQALTVFERLDKTTVLGIVANLVQTGMMVGGLLWFGLHGFFGASALGAALMLPLWLRAATRSIPELPTHPRLRVSWSYIADAMRFGGTTLVANGFAQLMFTSIRWLLEREGGPALNGQYQAASAVGTQYFTMVLASLGNFAFPRYAAAAGPEELQKEVRATIAFVLRLAPPVVLLGIAFRDVAVRLLYSLHFSAAADVLGWQMASDIAKGVSWAMAGPLLLRGRLRAYLLSEGLGVGFHLLASFYFIPRYGLIGEGYAQLVAYVLFSFVTLAILNRSCELRLPYRPVLITSLLTATAVILLVASNRWPVARWVTAAVGLGWAIHTGLVRNIWTAVRGRLARVLRRAP